MPQRQRAAQEPATVLIAHGEGGEPAVLAALASLRASLGGRGPTLRFASAERPGALLVLGAVGAQVDLLLQQLVSQTAAATYLGFTTSGQLSKP